MKNNMRYQLVILFVTVIAAVALFQNCGTSTSQSIPKANNSSSSASSTPSTKATPAPVAGAGCPANVVNNCTLNSANNGDLNGTCSAKYTGNCSYTCSNGNWTVAANTCTASPAPTIAFTQTPTAPNVGSSATIAFQTTIAPTGASTTVCALDSGAPAACVSPISLSNLSVGPHSLAVFVTDSLGNSTTKSVSWTNDACSPGTRMSCPVANGTGAQICAADGSGYGTCTVTSCTGPTTQYNPQNGQTVIPGYVNISNTCVSCAVTCTQGGNGVQHCTTAPPGCP